MALSGAPAGGERQPRPFLFLVDASNPRIQMTIGASNPISGFYVAIDGEKKGPYRKEQIASMWNHGILTADAVYWSESAGGWQPVDDLLTPEKLKLEQPASNPPAADTAAPFIRLCARLVDVALVGALFWLAQLCLPLTGTFQLAAGYFIYALYEDLFLVGIGATPGKWLLSLRVEDASGQRPSGTAAIRRAYAVAWRLVPVLFPFIAPFDCAAIRKHGATSYDRKLGLRVVRSITNRIEWAVSFAIVLIMLIVAAITIFAISR